MTPAGERPERITLGGGGSAPEVRQIMANVLGVPLSISPVQESSAFGAARVVAHALGWTAIQDGKSWGPGPSALVNPIQADHALYEERLAIFRDAAECTLPIMHRLQRLDS
jgi:sugar (pentulose or hexulose) kinase